MKILQVVHGYPPQSKGGTELYTKAIVNTLRQNHETLVVYSGKPIVDNKLAQVHFPALYKADAYNKFPICSKNTLKNVKVNRSFANVISRFNPEVIHFQHLAQLPFSLIETALNIKIPIVTSIHDFWFNCPRIHYYNGNNKICESSERGIKCATCIRRKSSLRRTIKELKHILLTTHHKRRKFFHERYIYTRNLLNRMQKVLVPSNFVYQKMIADGVREEILEVLPLGIEPTDKYKINHSHRKFQLCFVGTLKPHKGIYDLVRALQLINRNIVDLHIYATGSPLELLYFIRKNGYKNIKFHGDFDFNQRYNIYTNYDAVVVPSRCYETYSFVAREALLCGLPVIAPKHSVFLEIIKEKSNGYLFEPGNMQSLAHSIELTMTTEFTELFNDNTYIPTIDAHVKALLHIYNSEITK